MQTGLSKKLIVTWSRQWGHRCGLLLLILTSPSISWGQGFPVGASQRPPTAAPPATPKRIVPDNVLPPTVSQPNTVTSGTTKPPIPTEPVPTLAKKVGGKVASKEPAAPPAPAATVSPPQPIVTGPPKIVQGRFIIRLENSLRSGTPGEKTFPEIGSDNSSEAPGPIQLASAVGTTEREFAVHAERIEISAAPGEDGSSQYTVTAKGSVEIIWEGSRISAEEFESRPGKTILKKVRATTGAEIPFVAESLELHMNILDAAVGQTRAEARANSEKTGQGIRLPVPTPIPVP